MAKFWKTNEDPQLDRKQMNDLREHLKSQSTESLRGMLNQTKVDSSRDTGPYTHGGTPANVNKTISTIQEILDDREPGKDSENKG